MSIPTTRAEFKDYCLRSVGKGVLQVNISPEQLDDRIDEAIYMYQQYHMDAVIKTYMRHEVTASTMVLTGPSTGTFANGEVITGSTSNVQGHVVRQPNSNTVLFYTVQSANTGTLPDDTYADTARRSFVAGETVTGKTSAATGVVSSITLGDMDNKYFPVAESVIGITKVFAPFDSRMSADILFDPQSQFNISLLSNFTANSIIPYHIGRQYQQLLNDTFRGRPAIRFARHMNRLYVDVNWYATFMPGQHIVLEGYRTIDPNAYPDVWGDRWLQNYAIALIKRQWGWHLSKFGGISLPGGVQLNGKDMLSDAMQEIRDLEAQLKNEFQEPPMFIVG